MRTAEHNAKISSALKARAKTPEHKEAMRRAAQTRRPPTLAPRLCCACGNEYSPGSNASKFCGRIDCTSWSRKVAEHRASASKCAICGTTERLVADHCHKRNVYRGVLCSNCNLGIGYFKECPERMLAAIEYIRATATADATTTQEG